MHGTTMVVSIMLCVLLAGCGSYATIWSAKAESPSGNLVATAETIQNDGPGNASVDTSVYLKQPNTTQEPLLIVGFSNESAYPSGVTAVQLHWRSTSHLDVAYKLGATIDFQAIKALGIDITVHQAGSH